METFLGIATFIGVLVISALALTIIAGITLFTYCEIEDKIESFNKKRMHEKQLYLNNK